MERVTLVDERAIRSAVRRAFRKHAQAIGKLLPGAEIIHVGSTAVPGSLTKGDLDIQVRVPPAAFKRARAILSEHFETNTGSVATSGFASFKDDQVEPKLGIQLTAINGRHDFLWKFTAYLAAHPDVNDAYNSLKARYQNRGMAAYRRAKSRFLESLLPAARRWRAKE